MAMLRRGLTGEPVRILQEKLGVTADGIFGKNTEAALLKYQAAHGLSADGIAGPDTFTAMELHELVLLHKPIRGQMVKKVQEALGIGADGIFGSGTEAAVRKFQTDNGLDVNGMVDPKMLAMLPGFDVPQEKVEASLVTEATPVVDPAAVEEVKVGIEAPPEDPSFVSRIGDAAADAASNVSNVGKSIWTTVKSIF
ncbi:MAG: peptidoglycan-binding protein [Myxococcales bacterium]|nr:peptidoglycan-binding protein [Myxococcales bacterium]